MAAGLTHSPALRLWRYAARTYLSPEDSEAEAAAILTWSQSVGTVAVPGGSSTPSNISWIAPRTPGGSRSKLLSGTVLELLGLHVQIHAPAGVSCTQ
jgi:hypothetical protein